MMVEFKLLSIIEHATFLENIFGGDDGLGIVLGLLATCFVFLSLMGLCH